MESVCIVGAGPAGLVAAKTLLQSGHFTVTIYDQKPRIGGIWSLDEDTKDGFLPPATPTNLSRFTVAFSDHDWNAIDLEGGLANEKPDQNAARPAAPMFPKAWQVHKYLESYRAKFIPDDVLALGHKVIKAERKPIAPGSTDLLWSVTTESKTGVVVSKDFDWLIMASGFFSRPKSFPQGRGGHVNGDLNGNRSPIKVIHSSEFRSLDDLLPRDQDARGKRVLLIGAGNSAGEAGAAVAMQLSNAQWSPDRKDRDRFQGCDIIHVAPRPFYPLPPYAEFEAGSRSYVPIDLRFYNLAKRPPGPITSFAGQQPPEVRAMLHGVMQSIVGGNQSDLGSEALKNVQNDSNQTVYVALTETYAEFVRSALIKIIPGRVSTVKPDDSGGACATVQNGDAEIELDNIGAIIYGTGYTPSGALDFLSDEVKDALQYDPSNQRLPIMLHQWQTLNSEVPEAAFLGFYEGPYWPMIEMQARLTVDRWVDGRTAPPRPLEKSSKLSGLRKAMQDRCLDVPQYWFGDYLGYIEEVAEQLSLERNDGPFKPREGCTSPARYLSKHSDVQVAASMMNDLHKVWRDCTESGRFVARAAFRAMQGNWNISRRIDSKDKLFSGKLEGTASFHPRDPTTTRFDREYLYIESGTFTSSSGMTMTATRRYVYRYTEADDELSVWFVKPQNDLEVDHLFHNLSFVPPVEARKAGACIAKADHLCVDDMYWTEYRLPLKGVALLDFEIKHTVKGPQKDYVATTQYSRPPKTAI